MYIFIYLYTYIYTYIYIYIYICIHLYFCRLFCTVPGSQVSRGDYTQTCCFSRKCRQLRGSCCKRGRALRACIG